MTILLSQAVRVGGVVLAAGTTQTLAADLEADLVTRKMATYTVAPMKSTVPLFGENDPLTGGLTFSAGGVDITNSMGGGGGGGSSSTTLAGVVFTLSSQAYTTQPSDLGQLGLVTSGASNATITLLSAASAGVGGLQHIRKDDSGAGRVIVTDGSAALAWLSVKNDIVSLRSDGTNWVAVGWNIKPIQDNFTVVGTATWTKPPLATAVDVACFPGGCGGGSGRRGPTGAIRTGGGGGVGGGVFAIFGFPSASLPASLTVTVGDGGVGGPSQTVDATNGTLGSLGGDSFFGDYVKGFGSRATASGGGAGSTGNASGGAAATQLSMYRGGTGVSSSSTANATQGTFNSPINGGGGAGGSSDVANNQRLPCDGELGSMGFTSSGVAAGTAGTAGNPGGKGADADPDTFLGGGAGGGGGFYVAATAGTAGGGGGYPGGGGGGGAAADNGNNSGAGGKGGRGEVRVVTHF